MNGASPLPSARFGPNAAASIGPESGQAGHRVRAGHHHVVRDQILAQERPVQYTSTLSGVDAHRWEENPDAVYPPFSAIERDCLLAFLLAGSGDQITSGVPSLAASELATGMRATVRPTATAVMMVPPGVPVPLQLVGYRLANRTAALPDEPPIVEDYLQQCSAVSGHIDRLRARLPEQRHPDPRLAGSPIYNGTRLAPSRVDSRIWDINVDGLVHVGLLPDFLQDLENVGTRDLGALYRSANDYLRVWRRCRRRAPRVP
jgi:hypothetical protein